MQAAAGRDWGEEREGGSERWGGEVVRASETGVRAITDERGWGEERRERWGGRWGVEGKLPADSTLLRADPE